MDYVFGHINNSTDKMIKIMVRRCTLAVSNSVFNGVYGFSA